MKIMGRILAGFVVAICLAGGYALMRAGTNPPATVAAATPAQPNPMRASTCKALLNKLPRGAVQSYQYFGDGRGAVIVGPAYYASSFEQKELLDGTFRCIFSDGRDGYSGVTFVDYLDWQTHHEVASWSEASGFAVAD